MFVENKAAGKALRAPPADINQYIKLNLATYIEKAETTQEKSAHKRRSDAWVIEQETASQKKRNEVESKQPLVSINLRLKQMLELAIRRNLARAHFNEEAWLKIYAEGLARRPEGLVRSVLVKAARKAGIYFDDDDLADAIAEANLSFEVSPNRSAWSTDLIGKALAVTLCERLEFATHLGCFEETIAKRKARVKANKAAALRAKRGRKPQAESLSQLRPWDAEGCSRRTWERRRSVQVDANMSPIISTNKNCMATELRHRQDRRLGKKQYQNASRHVGTPVCASPLPDDSAEPCPTARKVIIEWCAITWNPAHMERPMNAANEANLP